MVALVLVAVAAGWLATPKTARYTAKSTIYVGSSRFSIAPNQQFSYDPTQLVAGLLKTYAQMLDSKPIAADAIGLARVPRTPDDVVKATNVTPVTDTQLLDVTVTDSDRQTAQRLSNAVSDAFIKRITLFESNPSPGTLPSAPAYIFQRADIPEHRDAT